MGIGLRRRTLNPKKGMVTKKRAEFREEGDRRKMREKFRRLISKNLDAAETANAISNQDVQFLMDSYMKRNDGGMAKKTRAF